MLVIHHDSDRKVTEWNKFRNVSLVGQLEGSGSWSSQGQNWAWLDPQATLRWGGCPGGESQVSSCFFNWRKTEQPVCDMIGETWWDKKLDILFLCHHKNCKVVTFPPTLTFIHYFSYILYCYLPYFAFNLYKLMTVDDAITYNSVDIPPVHRISQRNPYHNYFPQAAAGGGAGGVEPSGGPAQAGTWLTALRLPGQIGSASGRQTLHHT